MSEARAAGLTCWSSPVEPRPVSGGMTNSNYLVDHEGRRYFVRIGDDIVEHGVMRFNELAASKAAASAGISPEVVHHEPGAMVLAFVDGRTLEPADMRRPQVLDLVKRCHREVPLHLRGPALSFWVFQVLRDYAHTLGTGRFESQAAALEAAVGPITLVFGHNDLLASNFIDDGQRLWLVDWDYAGFNSALFDLGGLASNNEFTEAEERQLLADYFDGEAPWRPYRAMKCASLLRETMWSMVSERHSAIDFDYAAYTELNLARFERAWADFEAP